MMRSESTSALGQPSETKLTFGAGPAALSAAFWSIVFSTTCLVSRSGSMRPLLAGERGAHRPQRGVAAFGDRGLHGFALADRAHLALPLHGRARHMRVDAELAQGIGHFL